MIEKMFPESNLYKRKDLMFLVVEGIYYNVGNSCYKDDDYLVLCGLRFPLSKGIALEEEERNYMRRNRELFSKFKLEFDKKLNKESSVASIKEDLEKREDILFFLTNICIPEDYGSVNKKAISNKRDEFDESITLKIIGKNCAVINRRIYPLKEIDVPEFVMLNDKKYTMKSSRETIEEAESLFQNSLYQSLRKETLKESARLRGYKRQIEELEEKIGSFETATKISRYLHSYEFGDFGYDLSLRHVFWLIPKHYNKTTRESYEEGQSAVALTLSKEGLGNSAKFATRKDRNSPFVINQMSHCLGFSLHGNSIEEKMQYLRTAANVIYKNGAFHD